LNRVGPAHRFKKLCEKLQLILLSNKRQSAQSEYLYESSNGEKTCLLVQEEKESTPNNVMNRLELAHLSDTESESEILDSPRVSKKTL
jgi:hypothetical protein